MYTLRSAANASLAAKSRIGEGDLDGGDVEKPQKTPQAFFLLHPPPIHIFFP
jgi:hypothetical protein